MSHNEVNLKVRPILGFTSFTNTPFLSFIKLLRVPIFILSLSITFYKHILCKQYWDCSESHRSINSVDHGFERCVHYL